HLPGLAPSRVAEDEPVMQAQHLAVHVQHRLSGLVGDVGVLTQAEHALPDHVHLQLPPPALAPSRCLAPPSPPSPGRLHRQPGRRVATGPPYSTCRESPAPERASDERIASAMTWARVPGASSGAA